MTDSGVRVGGESEPCARVWINTNAWAVISGVADKERGNIALSTSLRCCNTPFGLATQNPPLQRNYPTPEEEISCATPGIGENGGIFCHANTWSIIALCLLNRPDDAYMVYSEMLPDHIVSKVGVDAYNAEPYIYSSNIRAPGVLRQGEAAVSWVTGTATWMNLALEHYSAVFVPKWAAYSSTLVCLLRSTTRPSRVNIGGAPIKSKCKITARKQSPANCW